MNARPWLFAGPAKSANAKFTANIRLLRNIDGTNIGADVIDGFHHQSRNAGNLGSASNSSSSICTTTFAPVCRASSPMRSIDARDSARLVFSVGTLRYLRLSVV